MPQTPCPKPQPRSPNPKPQTPKLGPLACALTPQPETRNSNSQTQPQVELAEQGTSGCVKPLVSDQFGYGTPVLMTPKCTLAAQTYPGARSSIPLCFQPADEFEVDTRPVNPEP